ncbi:GSCOCG00011398001-RA-CDS [Cotesia congregata]|nr:GSCOCG00011398001-RA-CDS [Cotesia congregata]
MDDDIDIYGDLENFDEKRDENCSSTISELKLETKKLENHTQELKKKIKNLEATNNTLKINLSSLLKTAKNEIVRKDRIIAELRQQLNNKTFRRNSSEQFKFNKPNDLNVKSQSQNKFDEINVKQEPICKINEPVHDNSIILTFVPNKKFEENDNFVPTVFGQRLKKKLREEEETAKLENIQLKRLTLKSIIQEEKKSDKGDKENQLLISSSNNQGGQNLYKTSSKRSNETDSSINLDKRIKLEEDNNEDNKIQEKNLLEQNTKKNISIMNTDVSCKNGVIEPILNKKHGPLDSSNNESKTIDSSTNRTLDQMRKDKKDSSNSSKKNINSRPLDNPLELFNKKNTVTVTSFSSSTKKIIIPRRRKAAHLTDSSTSMTIVVSQNNINDIVNKQKIKSS